MDCLFLALFLVSSGNTLNTHEHHQHFNRWLKEAKEGKGIVVGPAQANEHICIDCLHRMRGKASIQNLLYKTAWKGQDDNVQDFQDFTEIIDNQRTDSNNMDTHLLYLYEMVNVHRKSRGSTENENHFGEIKKYARRKRDEGRINRDEKVKLRNITKEERDKRKRISETLKEFWRNHRDAMITDNEKSLKTTEQYSLRQYEWKQREKKDSKQLEDQDRMREHNDKTKETAHNDENNNTWADDRRREKYVKNEETLVHDNNTRITCDENRRRKISNSMKQYWQKHREEGLTYDNKIIIEHSRRLKIYWKRQIEEGLTDRIKEFIAKRKHMKELWSNETIIREQSEKLRNYWKHLQGQKRTERCERQSQRMKAYWRRQREKSGTQRQKEIAEKLKEYWIKKREKLGVSDYSVKINWIDENKTKIKKRKRGKKKQKWWQKLQDKGANDTKS
uniref:Uncharacterized protein n=1 Tax=Cacopsylla melanoneura TaxID=428564 RepID=A0A8D8T1F4_9HEMI